MLKIRPYIYIAVFGVTFYVTRAQDRIVDLYEGTPPYSTGITSEEEWVDFRVSNVQIPQLFIYNAAPENSNKGAVIFFPGGGYRRLSVSRKGAGYAEFFKEMGLTTIIVKYRLPVSDNLEDPHWVPLTDATQAIKLVKKMADELNIDPEKVGIMGSSAGGHLASMLSNHYDESDFYLDPDLKDISSKPAFSILMYPVISMDTAIAHMGSRRNLTGRNPSAAHIEWFSGEKVVSEKTPPTFLMHGYNDESVSVLNSIRYYTSLVANDIPSEMHLFQDAAHGSGLGKKGHPWATWRPLCKTWLETHIFSSWD